MVPIRDLQPLRAATIGFYHTIPGMSSPKIHYFSGFGDNFKDNSRSLNFQFIISYIGIYANKNSHI